MAKKPGAVPEGFTRLNFNVETRLQEAFKAAVSLQGMNMTDALTELMRQYVNKHLPAALHPKRGRQ
jgi:hypothetical protein